ncbi:hypothetical protein EYF80_029833 [Liparis tanakae]|uniref:Uncharacterized protein n=1 Tax=Liparis tanakae TaxID=230148 RepID=A0A4Z2H316_9TELE|nr:hypothetical protein EYF80_029833 [Liparis tanakae]
MDIQSGVQQPEPRPFGSPLSGANQHNESDDRQTDASGGSSADSRSEDVQPANQKDHTIRGLPKKDQDQFSSSEALRPTMHLNLHGDPRPLALYPAPRVYPPHQLRRCWSEQRVEVNMDRHSEHHLHSRPPSVLHATDYLGDVATWLPSRLGSNSIPACHRSHAPPPDVKGQWRWADGLRRERSRSLPHTTLQSGKVGSSLRSILVMESDGPGPAASLCGPVKTGRVSARK